MENKENILVILTTYNQSNVTRKCLDTLYNVSDKHDVIVIDDKSKMHH